jgi:hypothetical protein
MYCVPYANAVGRLMIVMECSNISHAIGVVNGHMAKPSKERGNGCFGI